MIIINIFKNCGQYFNFNLKVFDFIYIDQIIQVFIKFTKTKNLFNIFLL